MTDPQALPQSPAAASQEFSTGDTLRRARESQGLSVADVANSLKLNPRQIDALESGRFDQLPGYAFTRGFLRNYARLLKLDAGPLLAGLQVPGSAELQELSPASNAQGDMPQVGRLPTVDGLMSLNLNNCDPTPCATPATLQVGFGGATLSTVSWTTSAPAKSIMLDTDGTQCNAPAGVMLYNGTDSGTPRAINTPPECL